MKTAIVIGATGVTGKPLTEFLLNSSHYQQVIVFSRRPFALPGIATDKLVNHVVDFDQLENWKDKIHGDDLFSALGTTRKQAGSQAAQYKVDFEYQATVIKAAAANGVDRLFLVSSSGANANSRFFYPRMKGELDQLALQQGFATTTLIKPSLIVGDRPDHRLGEKIGHSLLTPLCNFLPMLRYYRPIKGTELGRAIGNFAVHLAESGRYTLEFGDIFNHLPE